MERQIDVVGAESAPRSPQVERHQRHLSPLLTGVAGLAIGGAAMFVMTGSDVPSETTVPSEELPAPAIVTVTTATVPPQPRLSELVQDLETDLVGFGFTPSGSSVVQRWEQNDTEPRTVAVPFGLAIPDISGRLFAALVTQRYGDSVNLHVGNPEYQEPVATDVGSAVWSSDQPGRIAWTERTADGATIARDLFLQPTARRTVFNGAVPDDSRAVWLDGDQLVLATEGGLTAVAPDGAVLSRLDAATLVTGTDSVAVALIGDELRLIDTDLQPGAAVPVDFGCVDARFAPAGRDPTRRLAVMCEHDERTPTISFFDVDPSRAAFLPGIVVPIDQPSPMSWVDGDRFLAIPQPDPGSRPRTQIVIVDTVTAQVTELNWRGAIFQVIGMR